MSELTMEEKLRRWKQAKQEGLQRKQGRVAGRRHSVQEKTVGVKRNLSEAKVIGKKVRSTATQHSSEPGKNPRLSATKCSKNTLREKYSKPVVHNATHDSVKMKSHPAESGKATKTDLGARLQDGSAQSPILIQQDQEIPALTRRNLIKTTPVPKKSLPESKTPTRLPPQDGSARSPILIENDREIPILKSCSPPQPALMENKELPETRTPPLRPTKTFGADSDSDKENQCEIDVPINQNVLELPVVVTVEKKPELLAKDLIRVAIAFEKKRRLVTAYSIFKRAYHVLPKKRSKLTERLLRLEHECTAASLQLPSQELPTAAYMVKVLERDLMDILNNGSTKELADLHGIGAKRAELVHGRRPYHSSKNCNECSASLRTSSSNSIITIQTGKTTINVLLTRHIYYYHGYFSLIRQKRIMWQLQEQEEARRLRALLQQQQQEEEEARQLRVGLRQHGAPRWEGVRTDASFVERSRRRKPGALKAQERYLRRDVHCGVASCAACRHARALVPVRVLPREKDGEYVVPDAFSLLQCMELLEEETLFCKAAPRLLVLESVLQAALRLAPSRDASRLRKFFRDEDQRTNGGVSVYLFPDQHHVDTFVEPTSMEELQEVRDERAVLKTIDWYVTQGHLPPQARVVFMTRDIDASLSLQLAASVNAQAVTCESFLAERLPKHTADTAFLLELAANTAEALRYEEAQRLPDENGNVVGSQSEFTPHYRLAQLEELLAQPSSRVLAGKLEVSSHNPMEAYVLVEGPHVIEKVFVFGRAAMNRGVHGDRVAVEMLPKAHWRAPQSDRLLVHYTQDENEHEHESESVESDGDDQETGAIPTGQVVGIISRSPRYHVATVIASTVSAGDDYALAVPMDLRLPKIRLRSQRLDALLDKRLKVVIDSWAADSMYPNGHYVGILGAPGSLQTELSALLVNNEVEESPFSEAALACLPSSDECPIDIEGGCVAECSTAKRPSKCALLNWKVPDDEVDRRRDLRESHRIFSVDPHGCQDIDDAMSIRRLPNGNVELGVHIADVSYFVEHESALDLEGRRRGTTVYLVGQRLDMLPSVLSADLCSLHEKRDRLAVSVMWELDGETFDVVENSTWFGRTIIRSCSSMTYEQAHRLIQGVHADADDAPRRGTARLQPPPNEHTEGVAGGRISLELQAHIRDDLRILTDVGRRLGRTRGSHGGLDLSKQEEVRFSLNVSELGQEDVEITVKESLEIHGTIAELMIFANSTVAQKLVEQFPTHALLRRHPPPSGDRFTQLVQLAKARDVEIDATNNFTLQQSLAAAERSGRMDNKTMSLLKSLAVRVMTEAEYVSSGAVAAGDSAAANGDVTRFAHYGLGLQYYTHFTSPIRRYADVIVHRQLLAAIAAPSPRSDLPSQRLPINTSTPLVLPKTLVPSILETEDDEDFLDDLISSVDNQLQVTETLQPKEIPAAVNGESLVDADNLFPPEELVPLAQHLNKKNRQAKLAAHACDELFLALYFSSHTVKVPAIITALKQNGFIVYVPKYDFRAPVYLRDKSGVVQMDPLLLGVRIVDTDPATGAFTGAECIRRIPQAQLVWDDTEREILEVVASQDERTAFHILDEVEVQVSCDLTASGARVPQLQLLLVGRASAMRKKHIASSLSELQRVVQTKSEAENAPGKMAVVEQSKPSNIENVSSETNMYELLLNVPNLSPSAKNLARRNPAVEDEANSKKPGFKRRGPGRLIFGNFSTNSRRHYQHKLAQYMDMRSDAREEELKIQRFGNGSSAMTSAQEARRAEREALSRTQKLAAEKRHDRINRRNKAGK